MTSFFNFLFKQPIKLVLITMDVPKILGSHRYVLSSYQNFSHLDYLVWYWAYLKLYSKQLVALPWEHLRLIYNHLGKVNLIEIKFARVFK